jgi:MoaA/NifB/PqqE/SkfB family radical SAM enzyme
MNNQLSNNILDDVTKHLKENYDILYIQKVKYFLELPINQLYRELVKLKRDWYAPDQRIVLVDSLSGVNTKPFYNYLNRILTHLDIDSCFVHIEQYGNETVNTITNFDIPKTMCATPWINLEIRQQGNLTPCCIYKIDNYPNVKNVSVKDIDYTDLRQQLLDGEQPIGCSQCWNNEKNNVKSKRQNDAYVYRDKIFDIDYNDTKTSKLVSLDIKINKTCNLSCRMCGPAFSSKWANEVSQHKESYPQFSLLSLVKNEWTDINGSKVWKDLEEITSDLLYLTFSGGEPLLDKTHSSMLQYFINKQRSSYISLHYNTNATIFASNLIPLWSCFKEVELSFSIDNTGKKFEYERYGVSWKTIVDTIEKYKKVTDTVLNLNVWSTITTLNILDTYTLFQFCREHGLPISFNLLNDPKQLNICLFNKKQKKYITDKLLNIQDNEFQKIIEPIIALMNNSNMSTDITNMIDFLSVTDKIRKQDYKQTYEELAYIL